MDVKELEAIVSVYHESDKEEIVSIRKGAWSSEEDSILINYIAIHGEGRWNHLARNSGLKRRGKSCRLRWKNYLHPNVRRGNITAEEQLLIIELYCFYGNRWSKIAGFLPGRTDNEIKNYWRTRVQKQAKQLNYNIKSREFREFVRNIWLPRLSEQIQASKWNNLDDMTTNYSDGLNTTVPHDEAIFQMDYGSSLSFSTLSSDDVVEAHQVSAMDNLSRGDCCFPSFTASGLDFGPECLHSPFMGYGFQGIGDEGYEDTIISGEFSDYMLPRHDYFWTCP